MMQRYEIGSVSAVTGMAHLEEDDIGDYVLYSDAHALAERVAVLETALRREIANCANCEGRGKFKCGKCADDVLHDCKHCAQARKALAQTDGEAPKSP